MKCTVQTFVTLDGVMQAPGGPEEDSSGSFAHGGWQGAFNDPEVGDFVVELTTHADAYLLGRRTYEIFCGYWPDQTDPDNPIATALNTKPKHVASRTRAAAETSWRGEHPDTGHLIDGDVVDAVRNIKTGPGDELQVWGSGNLLEALFAARLVDRIRVMTFPLMLGSGRRLFNQGLASAALNPVDLRVTALGVVLGTYDVAGSVRYGDLTK